MTIKKTGDGKCVAPQMVDGNNHAFTIANLVKFVNNKIATLYEKTNSNIN